MRQSFAVRRLPLAAGVSVLLLALSACGGNSTASSNSSTGGGTERQPDQSQGPRTCGTGGIAGGMPGASGEIAAISGKTLQVQNEQSGQVAVSYTSKTTFSQQVSTSASALSVGDCVMVSSSSSGSSTDPVEASSVRISSATKGSCAEGRGRPGGRPSGMPSGAPSGMPSGAPSGMPSGGSRGGFGGAAFGTVTAITSDGFSVQSTRPGTSQTASKVSVAVSSSTTWTTNEATTSTSLAVGKCVSAVGSPDDTGAVKAASISVSKPVNGGCTGGFGQRQQQSQGS